MPSAIPKKRPLRVFVMMSGGVDSSVAAALLKKQGFALTGIFMKNWGGSEVYCSAIGDERDARRVAARLGIPFYVLNFEKEYYANVFAPFLQGIRKGVTPNPDVFCNQEIKFGIFLQKALALGADMVATGHYAGVHHGRVHRLLAAKDAHKDQTYFLYRLNQFQLSKTLFPLAALTKAQVRAKARALGLVTAHKPDSQGICFVGQSPFDEFLAQYISSKEGIIVDIDGRQVGTHKGVQFYTIGQRKGLGIGGLSEPVFVAKKDVATNTLIVAPERNGALYQKSLMARDISWVSGKAPKTKTISCTVRFRHGQPLQRAMVRLQQGGGVSVMFATKQRAITPGQSVVFYRRFEVLGGGIIA